MEKLEILKKFHYITSYRKDNTIIVKMVADEDINGLSSPCPKGAQYTVDISFSNEGMFALISIEHIISQGITALQEERLRKQHHTLNESWKQYQLVLNLIRSHDDTQ